MNKTFTITRTIDIDPEFYADSALESLEDNLRDNLEQDYSLSPTDRSTDMFFAKVYLEALKALHKKIEEELENYESEEN